jgi:hypothetical protein
MREYHLLERAKIKVKSLSGHTYKVCNAINAVFCRRDNARRFCDWLKSQGVSAKVAKIQSYDCGLAYVYVVDLP